MADDINLIIENLVAAISQKVQQTSGGTTVTPITSIDIIGSASRVEYLDKEIERLKLQQQFIQSIYKDSSSLSELEIENELKKAEKNKEIAKELERINQIKKENNAITETDLENLKKLSSDLDEISEKRKRFTKSKRCW